MPTAAPRSIAELTRACVGEAMTLPELLDRLSEVEIDHDVSREAQADTVWVGSAGYERYKINDDFAARLRLAGVERLVDVRQLPISRRRGYAKTALAEAMTRVGIEYIHMRALGNPKEFRDLYKTGKVDEGRAGYESYLLTEGRAALESLAELLTEKPAALMCVEHDASTCHRTVILDALQQELGLQLDVAEVT